MPHRRPPKCNILLDENFPPRSSLKRLNNRFNLKHLAHDLNKGGLEDPDVYKLAEELNRIIVTFNDKDFKDMASKSKKTGVIGLSSNLSNEQIDNKLTSFFSRCRPSQLFGKFYMISHETNI